MVTEHAKAQEITAKAKTTALELNKAVVRKRTIPQITTGTRKPPFAEKESYAQPPIQLSKGSQAAFGGSPIRPLPNSPGQHLSNKTVANVSPQIGIDLLQADLDISDDNDVINIDSDLPNLDSPVKITKISGIEPLQAIKQVNEPDDIDEIPLADRIKPRPKKVPKQSKKGQQKEAIRGKYIAINQRNQVGLAKGANRFKLSRPIVKQGQPKGSFKRSLSIGKKRQLAITFKCDGAELPNTITESN